MIKAIEWIRSWARMNTLCFKAFRLLLKINAFNSAKQKEGEARKALAMSETEASAFMSSIGVNKLEIQRRLKNRINQNREAFVGYRRKRERLQETLKAHLLTDQDRLMAVEYSMSLDPEKYRAMRPVAKTYLRKLQGQSPTQLRFLKKVLDLKVVANGDKDWTARHSALIEMNRLLGLKTPDPELN